MSIATRTGDGGKTSLMYGRRVEKFDLRVETYGTVDELKAALGLARAHAELPLVKSELFLIQKQLVALMGELAVAPEDTERYAADKYPKLTAEMLRHLDDLVAKIEEEKISFDGWATPGANLPSAALDVARTICRRAERLVAQLAASNEIDLLVIRYLNRLSDLLWLFARYTETQLGVSVGWRLQVSQRLARTFADFADGQLRIRLPENGRAGHDHFGSGPHARPHAVFVQAAIHFDIELVVARLPQPDGFLNLGQHVGHEFLATKARFHRHDQQPFDVAQVLPHRGKGRLGLHR